uniref:Bromo domain-containing protein n=1 Tax=Araucaria cunninghamii TaxID=56994 RepID=A0A0D6QZ70_ARACU
MASASMVGHDDSGSKHRWGESKLVYMRKGHGKGAKANPGFDATQNTAGTQGRRESGIMGNLMEANGRTDAAAAASDGSSSLSRKQVSPNNADHDHDHGGDVPKESSAMPAVRGLAGLANIESRVTIKLEGYSKQEICELRRKLTSELEQVRGTFKKLEARELQMRGCSFSAGANTSYSASHFSGNDARNNGGKEVTSEVASGGAITPKEGRRESKPMRQLSISVVENNQAASDVAEKGKRTPKVNQYYRNSEFVLGKDKFPPSESKKAKSTGNKKVAQSKLYAREIIHQGDLSAQKFPNEVYKQCISLLSKLMKQKHGWVFNSPVDAEALGLHDYHTIIKKPMDLGTVKSKLEKNLYNSPTSFAEDIRLTFSNAMTYNPEGHDVHIWAKQSLQLFEDRWKSIYGEQFENKMNSRCGSGQMPGVGANVKKFPFQDLKKNLKKSGFAGGPSPTKLKPVNYPTSRTPTGKKPKAKDPHKRDMTYEEKQKLSANLQNLPAERLELIVQIIKKRNPSLCQQDEEIEVDIDTFDTETLWELDRFVTNYKKSLSKNKKKALLAQQAKIAIEHGLTRDKCPTVGSELPKKDKKGEQGQEEVEIDDNMPPSNCPPVEIEKDSGGASRSSSSSSSSSDSGSSSSDSDSGSSSGSESDACAAQSPHSGSKMIPQD